MDYSTLSGQFPFVKLKLENDIVMANFNGAWKGVVNDKMLNVIRNYNIFLEMNGDPSFVSSNRNKHLIVFSDGEKFVSMSKSDLLRLKIEKDDEFAYVGPLGIDPTDPSNYVCLTVSIS